MVKFSLLVPLIRSTGRTMQSGVASTDSVHIQDEAEREYLVPAILLPKHRNDHGRNERDHEHEAYILIAPTELVRRWKGRPILSRDDVRRRVFLPMGIYPRLHSKVVTQMQRVDGIDLNDEHIDVQLSETCAKLCMENCIFSLSLDLKLGCIQIGFWDAPNVLVLGILEDLTAEV